MDMVRCVLIDSKLSLEFCAKASKCKAYILNRLPTKPISGGCSGEIWQQKRVSISHLRSFGCKAYFHVPCPLISWIQLPSKELCLDMRILTMGIEFGMKSKNECLSLTICCSMKIISCAKCKKKGTNLVLKVYT